MFLVSLLNFKSSLYTLVSDPDQRDDCQIRVPLLGVVFPLFFVVFFDINLYFKSNWIQGEKSRTGRTQMWQPMSGCWVNDEGVGSENRV